MATDARSGWLGRARVAVGWFLPLMVILMMPLASTVGEGAQVIVLLAAAGLWILMCAALVLPPRSRPMATTLRHWVRGHAGWVVGLAAGALLLAYGVRPVLLAAAPGANWAGLAVLLGLALLLVEIACVQAFALLHYPLDDPRDPSGARRAAIVVGALIATPVVVGWLLHGRLLLWAVVLALGSGTVLAALLLLAIDLRIGRRITPPRSNLFVTILQRRSPRPARVTGWLGLAATACAVTSSALLLLAALRIPLERTVDEGSQIATRGGTVKPPVRDEDLLEFYAPVMRLDPNERWVAGDALALAQTPALDQGLGDGTSACPTPRQVLDGITSGASAPVEAPMADEPCRVVETSHDPPARDLALGRPVFGHGKVYPRIIPVTAATDCAEGRLCRILDYWLFYPNNLWAARTAVGGVRQQHGGDWEHVAVGIDGAREPLFVAYSAHSCGSWRPWGQAPVVQMAAGGIALGAEVPQGDAGARVQASHPLVVVARGSHANYPTTASREVDPARCGVRWGKLLGPLAFVAGARESTPPLGPIQIPAVARPAESQAVLDAPWRWGRTETLEAAGFRVRSDGVGPDGPRLQDYGQPLRMLQDWKCEASALDCFRVRAAGSPQDDPALQAVTRR